MDESTALFSRLRPRLFGVAYRMLGSSHEAEDVVQDVWLRWHGTDQSQIENPEAWLVATTTRRAIDGLRLARHAREHYVGMWLPEPLLTDDTATPEYVLETASDLSVAFLSVLERLAPERVRLSCCTMCSIRITRWSRAPWTRRKPPAGRSCTAHASSSGGNARATTSRRKCTRNCCAASPRLHPVAISAR